MGSSSADSLEMLRAAIYLEGVLPLFEDLVQYDDKAAAAVTGSDLVVQFEVRDGPVAHLIIVGGTIRHGRGAHSRPDVRLWFKTPERLNQLFAGEDVRPGLRKGFRHLRFLLRRFPTLAGQLSYYMDGEGSRAEATDMERRRFLVGLRLRALLGGLAAVARNDGWLTDVVNHFPVGTLAIRVLPEGPHGSLAKVAANGEHSFEASYGTSVAHPNTLVEFADLEAAWRVVNAERGFEESTSVGDAKLSGNIVLAERMTILSRRLISVMGL